MLTTYQPAVHDWPARQLCAYDMHREIRMLRHLGCTISTCLMFRYCREGLRQLGHNPVVAVDECLVCDKSMADRYRFPDGSTLWP